MTETLIALTSQLRSGEALSPVDVADVRQRMLLDCCKWDAQVGDVSTLAPFPLLINRRTWIELAILAERLTSELLAAEREILRDDQLIGRLGLPHRLARLLARGRALTPAASRTLRFDFHLTDAGWRISEVNSDVPGGFTESSSFAEMMAEHYPGCATAGNVAERWSDAMIAAEARGPIALLAATGFMEDQQVVAYLAKRLAARNRETRLASPIDLRWIDGFAHLRDERLAAIVRFYQAEWLHARRDAYFFVAGRTPVANPGWSAVTESKRFPLVWPDLATPLSTWRALLPETRSPADAPWRADDGWLVKSAFCNTGDTVAIRERLTAKQWRSVSRSIGLNPRGWIAQRRFRTLPIDSPAGQVYPCLGVYTINRAAAGIYGRFSLSPVIDYSAMDAAVLVEETP